MLENMSSTSNEFYANLEEIAKKNNWKLKIYSSNKKYGILKLSTVFAIVYLNNDKTQIAIPFSTIEDAKFEAEKLTS